MNEQGARTTHLPGVRKPSHVHSPGSLHKRRQLHRAGGRGGGGGGHLWTHRAHWHMAHVHNKCAAGPLQSTDWLCSGGCCLGCCCMQGCMAGTLLASACMGAWLYAGMPGVLLAVSHPAGTPLTRVLVLAGVGPGLSVGGNAIVPHQGRGAARQGQERPRLNDAKALKPARKGGTCLARLHDSPFHVTREGCKALARAVHAGCWWQPGCRWWGWRGCLPMRCGAAGRDGGRGGGC